MGHMEFKHSNIITNLGVILNANASEREESLK